MQKCTRILLLLSFLNGLLLCWRIVRLEKREGSSCGQSVGNIAVTYFATRRKCSRAARNNFSHYIPANGQTTNIMTSLCRNNTSCTNILLLEETIIKKEEKKCIAKNQFERFRLKLKIIFRFREKKTKWAAFPATFAWCERQCCNFLDGLMLRTCIHPSIHPSEANNSRLELDSGLYFVEALFVSIKWETTRLTLHGKMHQKKKVWPRVRRLHEHFVAK